MGFIDKAKLNWVPILLECCLHQGSEVDYEGDYDHDDGFDDNDGGDDDDDDNYGENNDDEDVSPLDRGHQDRGVSGQ